MSTLTVIISDISAEDILAIVFPVLLGLALISVLIMVIAKNKRESDNDAQPVLREYAWVIDKQQLPPNTFAFETWVLFETESGRRVRLLCKANNMYVVGDAGRLTWQGTRMYGFELGKKESSRTGGTPGTSQEYIPAWKRVQMMEEQQK